MSSGHDRDALAREGEQAAASYLVERGYRLLGHRLRTRAGEIDLLMEHGELVVFVEVKTRRSTAFGRPAEAVTGSKVRHLRRAALSLCQSRPELRERPLRIDVVEVLLRAGQPVEITHLADAV